MGRIVGKEDSDLAGDVAISHSKLATKVLEALREAGSEL